LRYILRVVLLAAARDRRADYDSQIAGLARPRRPAADSYANTHQRQLARLDVLANSGI
jgi:hypothetical protein